MPTYGYRCGSCGHEFEVLQKMSDAPLKTCPNCGGELTKKVYAAGIVYKGSGYYSTDYKATGSKGSEDGSSNGESKTGSEGAGEGKPAKEAAESKSESKAKSESKSKSESRPAESSSTE
jgi:putative FmdB family regulatory protein